MKIILPNFNFKIEKWKWNKEFRVYVSSLGRFKDEHKRNIPIKISSSAGYCLVNTACGYKMAHRLVLLTFKPIPNAEDLTVDHLNHNKRDNSLNNLEWVTQEENMNRAMADLYIDQEFKYELALANNDIVVCGGNAIFKDIEAAADFLLATVLKGKGAKKDNVINKITSSIKYHSTYCEVKWKTKRVRIRKEDENVN